MTPPSPFIGRAGNAAVDRLRAAASGRRDRGRRAGPRAGRRPSAPPHARRRAAARSGFAVPSRRGPDAPAASRSAERLGQRQARRRWNRSRRSRARSRRRGPGWRSRRPCPAIRRRRDRPRSRARVEPLEAHRGLDRAAPLRASPRRTATPVTTRCRRPESSVEEARRLGGVGGLAEQAAADRDDGVGGEHHRRRRPPATAAGLGDGEPQRAGARQSRRASGLSSISGGATASGAMPTCASRSRRRGLAEARISRGRNALGGRHLKR